MKNFLLRVDDKNEFFLHTLGKRSEKRCKKLLLETSIPTEIKNHIRNDKYSRYDFVVAPQYSRGKHGPKANEIWSWRVVGAREKSVHIRRDDFLEIRGRHYEKLVVYLIPVNPLRTVPDYWEYSRGNLRGVREGYPEMKQRKLMRVQDLYSCSGGTYISMSGSEYYSDYTLPRFSSIEEFEKNLLQHAKLYVVMCGFVEEIRFKSAAEMSAVLVPKGIGFSPRALRVGVSKEFADHLPMDISSTIDPVCLIGGNVFERVERVSEKFLRVKTRFGGFEEEIEITEEVNDLITLKNFEEKDRWSCYLSRPSRSSEVFEYTEEHYEKARVLFESMKEGLERKTKNLLERQKVWFTHSLGYERTKFFVHVVMGEIKKESIPSYGSHAPDDHFLVVEIKAWVSWDIPS